MPLRDENDGGLPLETINADQEMSDPVTVSNASSGSSGTTHAHLTALDGAHGFGAARVGAARCPSRTRPR